jgi:diguanylate cyclase (GGDEF)-like protein
MHIVRQQRAKNLLPRINMLERYSDQLGLLCERQLAMTALRAAREQAERQAEQARMAAREAIASSEALRVEMKHRLEVQSRLAHLATHDPLTGLANRTLLAERLGNQIEADKGTGRSLALLYLDLDHFKDVNDTLGHGAGDALLRVVSDRLKSCLRADAMVARMGGDEFALWLPDIDADGALALAHRIRARLLEPVALVGHRVFIGVSIGCTLCPKDGDDVSTLLSNGDIAMYRAKQEGRNCVQMFDTALDLEVRRRASLEQALHEAMPLEQVAVAYQPQVDLVTGRLVGVEALLRWTHPGHGAVFPDEFVPIAERSGLINNLGGWILHESCRQVLAWSNAGLPELRVAVNLAAAQFKGSDVPRLVAEVLAATGLDPSRLELEITETGVMQDMRDAIEVLRTLASLGVTLAIDDFGTGYSSLSYLRKLPVDKIKVDRSFVSEVAIDEDAAAVARAMVGLAHSLRLAVVAEGVENDEQAAFMRSTQCEFAQGFLYGRPMPPDAMHEMLASARLFPMQAAQLTSPVSLLNWKHAP